MIWRRVQTGSTVAGSCRHVTHSTPDVIIAITWSAAATATNARRPGGIIVVIINQGDEYTQGHHADQTRRAWDISP